MALLDPDNSWPAPAGIAVASGARLGVHELTELIAAALFVPDDESGGPDEGAGKFADWGFETATEALLSPAEAKRREIEGAVSAALRTDGSHRERGSRSSWKRTPQEPG